MSKGEQTRQRIIEQAAPLFNQKGLAGCCMQDVMEATGLEKGGLYRHFSSKEELAAECLKYSLKLAFAARLGDTEHIPTAGEKLRYMVERFVTAPSPLKGGCPLMNAVIDADDGNPTLRRIAQKAMQYWKARLGKIVEEGIASGEILRATDPVGFANTVVALLEGSLLISRIEGSPRALRDAHGNLDSLIHSIAVRR